MLCFINYDNIKSIYEHPNKNTYNAQMTSGKPYKSNYRGETTKISNYKSKSIVSGNPSGDRYPTSVLKFGYDKDQIHPTQKSLDLCEYLIKTYSNENDIVLDFCAGSGSSIIGCIKSNRNYIGIEKNKDIFDIAKKRIDKNLFKEIII
jgi:site-specific DNA-methyltransferase (adenine-specific)